MRVLVLLNGAAGTLAGATTNDQDTIIAEGFARHGHSCDVRRVAGADLFATSRSAAEGHEYDLIIAGGGDGTLNTIASALVGSGVAFGVLPLGTFNHFAKELQIPLDLPEAVEALATGETVPFSLGRVNDRYFLLFCAVGLYSDMVRHRDAQREALGRKKMWAGTIAFAKMLVRWPLMKVRVKHVRGPKHVNFSRLTTTAYVSLSGYQMQQMGLQDVPANARNSLTLLISPHVKRRQLVGFLLKAMFNRAHSRRDLEKLQAQRLHLEVRRRSVVRVGYDGEVETMKTPLKIERVENALQMRVPCAYLLRNPVSVNITPERPTAEVA